MVAHDTGGTERYSLASWSVDYSKDVLFNYRTFTELAIISGHSEEIKEHVKFFGSLRDTFPEAPGWIPNWTRSRLDQPLEEEELCRITEAETSSIIRIKDFWSTAPYDTFSDTPPPESFSETPPPAPITYISCGTCGMANDSSAHMSYLGQALKIESDERILKCLEKSSREHIVAATIHSCNGGDPNVEIERCFRHFLEMAAKRTYRNRSLSKDMAHLLDHVLVLPNLGENGIEKCLNSRSRQETMGCWISWLLRNELGRSNPWLDPVPVAPHESKDEDTLEPIELDLWQWTFINDAVIPTLRDFLTSNAIFATSRLVGVASQHLTEENFVAVKWSQFQSSYISRQRVYHINSSDTEGQQVPIQIDRGVLAIAYDGNEVAKARSKARNKKDVWTDLSMPLARHYEASSGFGFKAWNRR